MRLRLAISKTELLFRLFSFSLKNFLLFEITWNLISKPILFFFIMFFKKTKKLLGRTWFFKRFKTFFKSYQKKQQISEKPSFKHINKLLTKREFSVENLNLCQKKFSIVTNRLKKLETERKVFDTNNEARKHRIFSVNS